MSRANAYVIEPATLDQLFDALRGRGYTVVGPRRRDDAIVYDEIDSITDLPAGWTDVQEPGRYRLRRRNDKALFGYAVGPHSWKKYLFPPQETLWQGERDGQSFVLHDCRKPAPKHAFIGVRACELQAITIQDRVFTGGAYADPGYARRRGNIFTVAVNCSVAGGNCFCVSMQAGPAVDEGYDLALTELLDDDRHELLLQAGSETGRELLLLLPGRKATPADKEAAATVIENTAQNMGRHMDTGGIRDLLYRNAEHPRWQDVAERCVSCGNCTLVCPTCFCSDVTDHSSLDGNLASRERSWASCFTQSFTYLAGGNTRHSSVSRYRHWLTHKLASWQDQFGSSGCVGCGRCITWCPTGIDITEEVAAIRASDGAGNNKGAAP